VHDGAHVRVVVIEAVHEHAVHEHRIAQRQLAGKIDEAGIAAFLERVQARQHAMREIVVRRCERDACRARRVCGLRMSVLRFLRPPGLSTCEKPIRQYRLDSVCLSALSL